MDLVTDSLVTNLQDAAAVNDFLCDASQIIDGGGNHENELKPANTIAILDYVTGGGFNCKNLPEGLQRQIRLRCRPG